MIGWAHGWAPEAASSAKARIMMQRAAFPLEARIGNLRLHRKGPPLRYNSAQLSQI